MKHLLFFILSGCLILASCSGKDPVYWYNPETGTGSAGSNVPYYPEKPGSGSSTNPTDGYAPAGYNLVWSDEFTSATQLYSDWYFESGGTGWGNGELQYYCPAGTFDATGQKTAALTSDGTLKITAYKIADQYKAYTNGKSYISTRMNTNKGWMHGYIEMRAKLPLSKGMWPAFWMLLKDGPYWVLDPSKTGAEIDIMEYVVNPPDNPKDMVYFSAHSYNATPEGAEGKNSGYVDPQTHVKYAYCQWVKINKPEAGHCYGMEWTHEFIRGLLDGVEYFYVPNPKPNEVDLATWPFDQVFNLKLNLAVGGSWGGEPAATFTEDSYEIDWVRVFQK